MLINKDLLPILPIKTSKSTSSSDIYACTYVNSVKDIADTATENINALANRGHFSARWAPNISLVSSIDKSKFGIYSINGGADTPVTGHSNDNWFIINIPSPNGNNYTLQIGFSLWAGNSSMGGTKIWWRVGTGNWQSTN